VAQFGGNNRDRCRWQIKGAVVGAAVGIFRRSKAKKISGTANWLLRNAARPNAWRLIQLRMGLQI